MRSSLLILLLISCSLLQAQDTLKMSLLFTGDIMQHESQIFAAYNPDSARYDYKPCFQFVKPILSAPDLTIGNLELTLRVHRIKVTRSSAHRMNCWML